MSVSSSLTLVERPVPVPGPGERPSSFEEVYDAMFPVVWRTARRLGIAPSALDDVCQETFVVVFRRLDEYDGRATLKSWVCGILYNVVRGHRRTRRRKDPAARSQAPLLDASELTDPGTGPHDDAERAEAAQIALRLLDEMDDDKRTVFVLADLEEMTVPEIATALEANVNTVYARLRAARRLFAQSAAQFRTRQRSGS